MYRYIVLAFLASSSVCTALEKGLTLAKLLAPVQCGNGISCGEKKSCLRDQWRCSDGSCIPIDGKCDGVENCPDGSDESHASCRHNSCAPNLFRCTYGACVDGNAPCNGVRNCADGSDELLPRCRNETTVTNGMFICQSGEVITADRLCDGAPSCADGSDETLAACAGRRCAPYLFQCAYGACVDADAECDADGAWQCADGSDETDDLCNRTAAVSDDLPWSSERCVLPSYPEHGSYSVEGRAQARPGQAFDDVTLAVACAPPYRPDADARPHCSRGQWYTPVPQCKQFCKLTPHPSVTYYCSDQGTRKEKECEEFVASGSIVRPQCNDNYRYNGELQNMYCLFTNWDNVATCEKLPKDAVSTGVTTNVNAAELADYVKIKGEGKNVTVIVKDHIFVYVSGSDYTVTVANASEAVVSVDVPSLSNISIATASVAATTEMVTVSD